MKLALKKMLYYASFCMAFVLIIPEFRRYFNSTRFQRGNVNNFGRPDDAAAKHEKTLNSKKNFIYMVQAAKCIPKRLLAQEFFGNASICDVLVFSYKAKCLEHSGNHTEYIFTGNYSTWTVGRNSLYHAAHARDVEYLYYIFLDDDITLKYHKKYASPSLMATVPPLRAFEEFLVTHEPAVGVVNYNHHHTGTFYIEVINKVCPGKFLKTPDHIPVVHFDALFNAFHRDAIQHILPYTTDYDSFSWWESQRMVITITEMLFRGHTIMYTPVQAVNLEHRTYPQNRYNVTAVQLVWSEFARKIKKQIPQQYQEQKWIQEFIDNPLNFTDFSSSVCLDLPAHHPIKPFSHFTLK